MFYSARVKWSPFWGNNGFYLGGIKQNLVFEGKEHSVLNPSLPLSKTEFRFGVKRNALMQKNVMNSCQRPLSTVRLPSVVLFVDVRRVYHCLRCHLFILYGVGYVYSMLFYVLCYAL